MAMTSASHAEGRQFNPGQLYKRWVKSKAWRASLHASRGEVGVRCVRVAYGGGATDVRDGWVGGRVSGRVGVVVVAVVVCGGAAEGVRWWWCVARKGEVVGGT